MKIKQTVKYIFISLVMALAVVSFSAPPASAADTECGGVKTSIISCGQDGKAVCKDGSTPDADNKCEDGTRAVAEIENTGIWGILIIVINIMTAGVGILAVAGIVYGAVLYTSAGGSSEQVKKAISIITNVVIGLIAYALMFAFLNFIIPGGLFN